MEYVPCIGNSSYSFWWILLKLYICFKDGLEICILFFQNPEIIFYHFFRIFMPRHQKVAGYYVIPSEILSVRPSVRLSVCPSVRPSVRPSAPTTILVSATPPTVLGQSFWNFTGVLRMVWRYAYCFFRILKLFFIIFFPIFNLDIFRALILQICIWSMYLVSATPPTVFGQSFSNFTGVLRMVWRYAYCFFRSWNYFLSLFSHF